METLWAPIWPKASTSPFLQGETEKNESLDSSESTAVPQKDTALMDTVSSEKVLLKMTETLFYYQSQYFEKIPDSTRHSICENEAISREDGTVWDQETLFAVNFFS